MKIKKLTIRNIASIESAEIDFENGPLKDSPLFLICGETGSGKTTILDAITLALYGKTPRYDGGNRKREFQIGGMAFNDVRQLVRHGAAGGCAALEFVGNDSKPYEARWEVDIIMRGQNKGRLNNVSWKWKDNSKGGIEYTSTKDIASITERAIGLGFEQFCRTTLLAQGQFTKFLLGDEDAKAEILEKLTNTEKFRRFGVAIWEKYSSLDSAVDSIEREINRLAGLGEERAAIEAKISGLENRLKETGALVKALEERRNWLGRREELANAERKVKAELVDAFASLKATEEAVSSQLEAIRKEVEDTQLFLRENESKKSMYSDAPVILRELEYVRVSRIKKAEAEANREKYEKLLPKLEKEKEAAAKVLEEAKKALDDESERENRERLKLEALNLKGLRDKKDASSKRRNDIKFLGVEIESLEKLSAERKTHEEALAKRRSELAAKVAALPTLEKALERADEGRNAARNEREKIERLLENGVEKIVASLHVGDVCPICKSKIASLNSASVFSELMDEKNIAYEAAEKVFRRAEADFNSAKSAVDGAKIMVAEAEKQIVLDEKNLKTAQSDICANAEKLGIDGSREGVLAALVECDAQIRALLEKIEIGEAQEKALWEITKSVKRYLKTRDEARKEFDSKNNACNNCNAGIKEASATIADEEKRAEDSLLRAGENMAIPGWKEAWEAGHINWEAAFKSEAAKYKEREDSLFKVQARLDFCAKNASRIAACRMRALECLPELAQSNATGDVDEQSCARIESHLGTFAFIGEQLRASDAERPEGLLAEDTLLSLAEELEKLKSENETLRDNLAAEKQKIIDDDKRAKERAAMQKKLESERALRDEWKPIADLFGDREGKKIRREIQAYVQMNVLAKANSYLKQLSKRYELSCEGLVLSVIDANEGYVERPVNTLSGGEQFLVALALALGLAGMNDSGLSVDMLLIDEGFGTLSANHLNAAIEALERLNALTGTRKVGVISHVERLRERIKTHIEVTRNGHEPSKVEVK